MRKKIITLTILSLMAISILTAKTETVVFDNLDINKEFTVDVISSIDVKVDDSLKKAKVIYTGENAKNIELKQYNGKTYIKEEEKKTYFFSNNSYQKSASYSILLPKQDFDELSFHNIEGDIVIHDNLNTDEISIKSISGDVRTKDLISDDLDIKTISGNIYIDKADIEESSFASISGNIFIKNLNFSYSDIKTISGNIQINNLKNSKLLKIDSTSGSVSIGTLDKSNLSFKSLSGKVKGNYSNNSNNSKEIVVKTLSSDLIITD